jgi:hypothetical protein
VRLRASTSHRPSHASLPSAAPTVLRSQHWRRRDPVLGPALTRMLLRWQPRTHCCARIAPLPFEWQASAVTWPAFAPCITSNRPARALCLPSGAPVLSVLSRSVLLSHTLRLAQLFELDWTRIIRAGPEHRERKHKRAKKDRPAVRTRRRASLSAPRSRRDQQRNASLGMLAARQSHRSPPRSCRDDRRAAWPWPWPWPPPLCGSGHWPPQPAAAAPLEGCRVCEWSGTLGRRT